MEWLEVYTSVTYCACGTAARLDGAVMGRNRGEAVPSMQALSPGTPCHAGLQFFSAIDLGQIYSSPQIEQTC
jgi:hypothetical protein